MRCPGFLRAVVLLSISLGIARCSGRPVALTSRLSASQARADLEQLRDLLYGGHPMTFTDRAGLTAEFDRQRAALTDSLTVLDFYRVTSCIVAMVRCGHTELSLPDEMRDDLYRSGHFLPLDVRVIRDTLFVYRSYASNTNVAAGCVIVSINSVPAEAILNRLRGSVPADGAMPGKRDFLLNGRFSDYYLRFVEDTPSFEIEYAIPPGDPETHTAMIRADTWKNIRTAAKSDTCRWEEEAVVASVADDGTYAVLRIPFFDYGDERERFRRIVDSFFATLSERRVGSLILDLRGNQGGDAYSAAYLLGYLLRESFRYFSPSSTFLLGDLKEPQPIHEHRFAGNLYVLTDGGCCSTTGHLCALLRYHGVGTFIGAETGGSYLCHGGFREHDLRHSRLHLLLPQATFIAAVEGLPRDRGIPPHHVVAPSLSDLLNCNHRVLDSAVHLARAAVGSGRAQGPQKRRDSDDRGTMEPAREGREP
ncbi:MAG: S41 family peptidase [Candidatus Zixiibacteriota bacterium]